MYIFTCQDHHPDDVAEICKLFNIDKSELERPIETAFSQGLQKLSQMRYVWEYLLRARQQRERDQTKAAHPDDPEADVFQNEREVHEQQRREIHSPLWKILTGIPIVEDIPHAPRERRRAITILINCVEKLIRYEIEHAEPDDVAIQNSLSFHGTVNERLAPSLLRPKERTVYWDPIQSVCAALGLSRIALTRFSKELTGLAAHEIVDTIKVESVKPKLKEVLRPQLRAILQREHGEDWAEKAGDLRARDVWHKLKKERTEPEFNRVVFAQSLGFPNYNRYFRACTVVFHQAPQQIELELIEEFLRDCRELQQGRGVRGEGSETATATAPASATATSERPLGVHHSHSSHHSHEPQLVQKNTGVPEAMAG
ncbi:MAG TPA: hypothetical protein VEJ63_15255 [Planctomycetota bacterium]|nr:hypothetical protein [Planctomycetota bacterium]